MSWGGCEARSCETQSLIKESKYVLGWQVAAWEWFEELFNEVVNIINEVFASFLNTAK